MSISKKKIAYAVLFIHWLFLFLFTSPSAPSKETKGEIHVKTYVHKERTLIAQTPVVKKAKPVRKSPSKAKKKKVGKKTTKSQRSRISSSLLKELQQNIDSVSTDEPSFEKKELAVPKKIISLQIDQTSQETKDPQEISFDHLLGQTLQEKLTLPDFGDVKARLTLNSAGSLLQLEILNSNSKENEGYLKNQLPQIAFPCFNETAPERKIVITFKNQ